MESERPQLSITLPRNFMFHYRDGQVPRTPEPEPQPEQLQPPAPPRQTLKVRRRRTTFAVNHEFDDFDDVVPIPTIEAPEPHSESSVELPSLHTFDTGYLSPGAFGRMISPPKTPVSQMRSYIEFGGPQNWSDIDQASQSSSRPTSSSGFSDSSISSGGSFHSFPSLGGSCTSPEDDAMDPFSFDSPDLKYRHLDSPLTLSQPRPQKKLKLRTSFTEEMDRHLWMTYMRYLQDPTVTPFKALPTTCPPNGVCHRVARMARRTWRTKTPPTAGGVRSVSQFGSRHGTPDTIKPAKSGSSTPVPGLRGVFPRYPTEKQCRRRLRDLARQKPSLSAHYQRLLNGRSPSPLQSSPEQPSQSAKLSSPFPLEPPSFSTRDMNVSLATSTAPSMQFGNPLAQLASEPISHASEQSWSNMRSSAHQKSQSLHIGLGLGLSNLAGSPFHAMSRMTDMSFNQHNSQTWHAPSTNPPRLGSPLQLHAPRPISRPFKRRALHNFEQQTRNRGNSFVDQVFGAPAESSHRRVRSRGFSLGDMVEGARRLPLSNSGYSGFNPFAHSDAARDTEARRPFTGQESYGHATVRLGSPFGVRMNNKTFPRTPLSSSFGFEPPVSFEQRFAAFNPNLPSDPAHLPRM